MTYFKGLSAQFRASLKVGSQHGEPLSLVKAAISHKERAPRSREDRMSAYDEVWCVMDVEAPVPHASLEVALDLARKNGISVALANPCFELWIFLHFKMIAGYKTSTQMQELLLDHGFCGYCSDGKDIRYEELRDFHSVATGHAVRLKCAGDDGFRSNPSTNIHELVCGIRNIPTMH